MALIAWEDKLSVNIELLDEQHKGLVALINTLYDSAKSGQVISVLESISTELVNYTVTHFKTEEELFQEHGYPESEQHKKEHELFTKYVSDLKDNLNHGKSFEFPELIKFLLKWLYEHILVTDKKYTVFLNRKDVF